MYSVHNKHFLERNDSVIVSLLCPISLIPHHLPLGTARGPLETSGDGWCGFCPHKSLASYRHLRDNHHLSSAPLSIATKHNKTCRQRYHNAVNFLQTNHNRHLIACPWGRGMGCLLWAINASMSLFISLCNAGNISTMAPQITGNSTVCLTD